MPSETTPAKLRWDDGDLPVSAQFDDPYYSRSDGLAESRHVFLDGNDLPARFATTQSFHIAELGFGTGLNMLAAAALWQGLNPSNTLHLTSFERYPMQVSEMARALSRWSELSGFTEPLLTQWPASEIALPNAELTIVFGDVADTLPVWVGIADAWFLDGFAPSRNPEMWAESVLNSIARHTQPGGTFATYTAAGFVRRGLQATGFSVSKRRGFGSKREMLTGCLE